MDLKTWDGLLKTVQTLTSWPLVTLALAFLFRNHLLSLKTEGKDVLTPTRLRWAAQIDEFSPQQQKVLLALSDEQYLWRTRDRLIAVTDMAPSEMDKALASLIEKNLARPAFSKKRNIVLGLRERVDKK